MSVDRITAIHGDSREVLKTLADCSVDSCVCDPPYGLVSITNRWSGDGPPPRAGVYRRSTSGFMGQKWDTGETAHDPEFWREVYRVLKPGAHVVAFGGTRTFHRLVCAIEDAGFEVRDLISWIFGSGFPKSHNAGNGWGTALKPALEPITLARKPLVGTVAANVQQFGTGAINVDGCRVATDENRARMNNARTDGTSYIVQRETKFIDPGGNGRWPANVIHDGSEEVVGAFPDTDPAKASMRGEQHSHGGLAHLGGNIKEGTNTLRGIDDAGGSASRFFYSAKADGDDRLGSKHPTVKPIDLMQWLVRLVTPKGGLVLDPFAGTGTTGEAAYREGMRALLIEREPRYFADIQRRIKLLSAGPDERARESIKASGKVSDAGPLFGGLAEPIGGGDRFTVSSRTNDRTDGAEMVKRGVA